MEKASECRHYSRGCRLLAPCCNEWVGCRLCHNELFTDHEVDRHTIRMMQCLECNTVQPCARECIQCATVMGEYFCGICNLFDNDGGRKKIFHCDDCGICRVGGRENFYHCTRCCGCYPHSLNNHHRCVDGSMHRECAICLERTFDSIRTVNVLNCGHVLHHSCYREYVRYGNVVCPTCRTSLLAPHEQAAAPANGEAGVDAAAVADGRPRREVLEVVEEEDEEEDEEEEDDDDDDENDDDDDSEVSDTDAVLVNAAGREIDGDVLRAVAWEFVGENDVEGLNDSEEEEEEVAGHR